MWHWFYFRLFSPGCFESFSWENWFNEGVCLYDWAQWWESMKATFGYILAMRLIQAPLLTGVTPDEKWNHGDHFSEKTCCLYMKASVCTCT